MLWLFEMFSTLQSRVSVQVSIISPKRGKERKKKKADLAHNQRAGPAHSCIQYTLVLTRTGLIPEPETSPQTS